ncbi:hypothetical protein GCM10022254_38240 [Actinomadura meridiana]|uniref:Uncharacterized protein n=1 Tax=Actinomadura meridiana TaxID=559626 RepID=A0ABP8C5Z9_9ACTN
MRAADPPPGWQLGPFKGEISTPGGQIKSGDWCDVRHPQVDVREEGSFARLVRVECRRMSMAATPSYCRHGKTESACAVMR